MEKQLEQIQAKLDLILELLNKTQLRLDESEIDIEETSKDPREVKLEALYSLDDDKFIEDCLIGKSIAADVTLLQRYYLPADRHSIVKCSNNSVKYWLAGKWNKDIMSEYTKTILCKNLINCYLKVNSFERYENNMDRFIENQAYIKKLRTPKHQGNLMIAVMKLL